jgi:hypothetical protein
MMGARGTQRPLPLLLLAPQLPRRREARGVGLGLRWRCLRLVLVLVLVLWGRRGRRRAQVGVGRRRRLLHARQGLVRRCPPPAPAAERSHGWRGRGEGPTRRGRAALLLLGLLLVVALEGRLLASTPCGGLLLLWWCRWPDARRRGGRRRRDDDVGPGREGPALGEEGGQQRLGAATVATSHGAEEVAAIREGLWGQERRPPAVCRCGRGHGPVEAAGVFGRSGALLRHQLPERSLFVGVGEGGGGRRGGGLLLGAVVVAEGGVRELGLEEGEPAEVVAIVVAAAAAGGGSGG